MSLFLFMLPFMLAVGGVVLGGFVWAVRADQFDDLEGEKHRIFFEDHERPQRRPARR
jgi:cbb3-type cytochrome oxidase maturation protein